MENLYHIGYSEKGVLLQRSVRRPRRGGEGVFMAKHSVNTTYLVEDQENNTYHYKNNGKAVLRFFFNGFRKGEKDGQ